MVLRGAEALAIPTKMGQSLEFESNDSKTLKWESWDHKNQLWFNATIDILDFSISNTSDVEISLRLAKILKAVRVENSQFLKKTGGIVKTYLEFDRHWGLGSSSTLIFNLAQWSQTNPYNLLQNSFGGSGYDIACANSKSPLIFRKDNKYAYIEKCEFSHNSSLTCTSFTLMRRKSQRGCKSVQKQKISKEQIAHASKLTRAITIIIP